MLNTLEMLFMSFGSSLTSPFKMAVFGHFENAWYVMFLIPDMLEGQMMCRFALIMASQTPWSGYFRVLVTSSMGVN